MRSVLRLAVLALLLVLPARALAVVALVAGQTATAASGFGTSPFTITLPNNPTTNNLVVVAIEANSSVTGIAVADTNGNAYTATTASLFTASGRKLGIYYLVAPANAIKTITVTITTPTAFTTGWAAEFSGTATAAPFERDATASFGGAGTTINTPSITTTNNGDLLVAIAAGYVALTGVTAPWTAISTQAGDNGWSEYYVQSSAGAQAVGFTMGSSSNWDAMSAAFKAAPPATTTARASLVGVGK
jgi:hypothetical protein